MNWTIFIIAVTGMGLLIGANYIFNPSIDEDEEYWAIQEKVTNAELETQKVLERIDNKKHKTKNGPGFLDKLKDIANE